MTVNNVWFATIIFFNPVFKRQDYVCSHCDYLTMLCLDIGNMDIITVKEVH